MQPSSTGRKAKGWFDMKMATQKKFPKLEELSRPTVETASAAFYLNRKAQTLRGWACHDDGPIRPIRINGRLAWNVSELKRVLGVAA
jgi:hypothetical protein